MINKEQEIERIAMSVCRAIDRCHICDCYFKVYAERLYNVGVLFPHYKIGDKVYDVYYGNIREWVVSFIGYTGKNYYYNFTSCEQGEKVKNSMYLKSEDCPKKFMTKEEAEELLEKQK